MEENQDQIDALQQAYQDDGVMTQVMNAFGKYKNAMREVPVDRIWDRIGRGAVKRSDVVAALKQLQELGFGSYTKGAHGYASRFGFARSQGPLRLSMLARGIEEEEDLPDDFYAEGDELKSSTADLAIDSMGDAESVTHRFLLRQDLEVAFSLPADLSFKEAKRLSLWLKSIPFDSDGEEF
ncbi:hypothetical protein QZM05_22610 [Burkholderia multivorans]|nr:hypothetical protein [Burkholderia multivorans]